MRKMLAFQGAEWFGDLTNRAGVGVWSQNHQRLWVGTPSLYLWVIHCHYHSGMAKVLLAVTNI